MKILRVSVAAFLLSLTFSLGYAQAITIGLDIDVTASDDWNSRQQVEPSIAIDPTDPATIVAGAQDLRLVPEGKHRWLGYYRSTDGGKTWSVSLLPGFPGDLSTDGLASTLSTYDATTDPVLAFDNQGNVFYSGIAIRFTPPFTTRVFVAKYSDHGATYNSTVVLDLPGSHDKEWIAVDTSGRPETNGNVYLVWDAYILGVTDDMFTAVFSRSTDHGATFSTPIVVPAGGGILPFVTVDPQGGVFVSSLDMSLRKILVSRSSDGGLSFQTPVVAAPRINALLGSVGENLFRAHTIPQIAAGSDGVYVVWDDFRGMDSDVLFIRSYDGGVTWTNPVRVNNVGKGQQFFPTIAVSGGRINIAWYDSRLDNGQTIRALDVFYAQSADGGRSFSDNVRVTTVSFDPNLVKRTDPFNTDEPFIGDYIHIAASPTEAHPIWADNRNACNNIDLVFGCVDQDVFTTTILF